MRPQDRSLEIETSRFNWRHAAIGLAGGVAIGFVAKLSGAPAWWWLAVPIAPIVLGLTYGRDSGQTEVADLATAREGVTTAVEEIAIESALSPTRSSVP